MKGYNLCIMVSRDLQRRLERRADLLGLTVQDDFPEADLNEGNTAAVGYCVSKGRPEGTAGADFVYDDLHPLSYTARYALMGLGFSRPSQGASPQEHDGFCRGFSLYGVTQCIVRDIPLDATTRLQRKRRLLAHLSQGMMADFEAREAYVYWRNTYPNFREVVKSDSRDDEPMTVRAMREMGAVAAHRLRLPLV